MSIVTMTVTTPEPLVSASQPSARRCCPSSTRCAACRLVHYDLLPNVEVALAEARPDGVEVSLLHMKSPEHSWNLSVLLARRTAGANRTAATAMLEEQFAQLGKVPVIWPDLSAFYRDHGQVEKAKNMSGTCVLEFAAYREQCIANATTESERKTQEAANERKSKEIVDKTFKRMGMKPR